MVHLAFSSCRLTDGHGIELAAARDLTVVNRRPPAVSHTDAGGRRLRNSMMRADRWRPVSSNALLGSALRDRYREAVQGRWIRIRISTQILEVLEANEVVASYAVSTAAKGIGERMGSEQTPLGRHEVRELIGKGAQVGTVIVGRRATGEICTQELQAANSD